MWSNSEPFIGEYGVEILRQIVATGRAHWLAATGPRLTFGEPRHAAIVWRFAEAETMRPFIDAGDGIVALNARPPLYVDPAAGLIGEFDTGLEPKLTHALLSGPAVSPRHVKTLGEKMTKHLPALADFVPADPGPPIPIEVVPKPVLRLSSAQLPWPNRSVLSRQSAADGERRGRAVGLPLRSVRGSVRRFARNDHTRARAPRIRSEARRRTREFRAGRVGRQRARPRERGATERSQGQRP